MRFFVCLMILLGAALSAGCQPNTNPAVNSTQMPSATVEATIPASPTVEATTPASPTPLTATPDKLNEPPKRTPELIPTLGASTAVTGEVPPELLASIQKDLAERSGAAAEQMTIVQAQAIVWNDGALGCPQPGVMYTQAEVSGYRVILTVGNQPYDYHAADTGYFILCEGGLLPHPPQGTPNS